MRDSSEWRPTAYRSHTIGEVASNGADMIGSEVTVAGYAETVRGRGGVCFLMLRDGTGHIQAFLKRDNMDESLFGSIQSATRESTIQVTGTVAQKRPPKVAEGEPVPPPEYEVNVTAAAVLADAAAPLPVGVTDDVHVGLDVRLDNRHLDLRRAHVNAMFQLRSKVLQYGRDHLISEGFQEINTPKIIAAAAEGGTNLFPMKYFETDAYLSQSPQLYKQLAVLGGLERVFEIGPAFRAEKHDTYRHLNEFISFDIEGAWMDDEDVMGVQERMIHHIWGEVAANDQSLIDVVNEYHASQGRDPVILEVPDVPFPRIPYCDAIEIVKAGGGEIGWGDDIESHHCDIIAAEYPGFHFIPRWPMSMKPFYIHHKEGEEGSSGGQLSRGFDLNYGRDEMTSGGQREHRVDVLEQNLRNMGLEPADFTFYTDGFRYGAPPHAGWGLGVARLLMVLTGAGNVREVVLFPRDRSRVTP
ncbi:MAG: aspartate--tRNA(Asn) ligase [Methanobacteriota archaeon]|jgi:nondiscriminating aspartyl-tRNA synthetase|uniref:Aspartate--tRNA ligase n=1 Tax=uncultured marine group II/III euryarchaeote KM3_149_G01 TaxID=1457886 RepID=A0A075GI36_9EURY|nr:aspartyl-tRNA synthetase (DARS, aspS) [uncultured marine group II/III euryarchaeote KM3_149_G01]GIT11087.1 MAG: aspartate--tRNA(Asn) ligase [Euryarchaeota archaeon]